MKRSDFLKTAVAALAGLAIAPKAKSEPEPVKKAAGYPSDVPAVNAYGLVIPKMCYRNTQENGFSWSEYSKDGVNWLVSSVACVFGANCCVVEIPYPMTIAQVKEAYTFPVATSSASAAPSV